MKVKKISVMNLKAVSELTADFNGHTAIITGGNNKGKSSFLRSLPERLRGNKPAQILKEGEDNGFSEWTLTDGSRLRWEFENKTKKGEKLVYISDKDVKAPLTSEIMARFFPSTFDVDKFLASQPAQQRKQLQEIVGVDFSDVDKRYKEAFEEREGLNRTAREKKTIFENMPVVLKVDVVDISQLSAKKEAERTRLNTLYLQNKSANETVRKQWQQDCDKVRHEANKHNQLRADNAVVYNQCYDAVAILNSHGMDKQIVEPFLEKLKNEIPNPKDFPLPTEPEYIPEMPEDADLQAIDKQIMEATETNAKAAAYTNWLTAKQAVETANTAAADADKKVKDIEAERVQMIADSNMPEGFAFTADGITYKGLEFTREQQSSSGIYIAALQLAAMKLGEVRTLHFDASFLDKNNLMQIEQWAHENDLQLLIERPDFEGGDIEYHIVENTN